jgi:hypothetical protein
MMLPAAERAAQVPPTGVAGVRKEANSALRAGSNAPEKLRMALQDRVQRCLILPDKRPGAIVLMPICANREKPLDGYGKKARLSTIISTVLYTPSSYLFDANASRGRARFFVRYGRGSSRTVRANSPSLIASLNRSVSHVDADRLRLRS